MGSTWEDIVKHVSQVRWEEEYKNYLLDCNHSTRYMDYMDKKANTDLPTPFHIDTGSIEGTNEDWATIENMLDSMVKVLADVCVPLNNMSLSSYGWPNVEKPRSVGNGNCPMHSYLHSPRKAPR
jgi:hypothetical protein